MCISHGKCRLYVGLEEGRLYVGLEEGRFLPYRETTSFKGRLSPPHSLIKSKDLTLSL